jgi:NADH:ubiquinone oxidoreductase subunit C
MKNAVEKSVVLNATKEKVWDVLVQDKLNRQWYAVFCEGTHARTDWKEGSRVVFTDQTGDGMLGRIAVNKQKQELDIEYVGFITGGKEDLTGEEVKPWVGLHEIYKLSEEKNGTRLDIRTEVPEKHLNSFNEMWDKAVAKIKELSENA